MNYDTHFGTPIFRTDLSNYLNHMQNLFDMHIKINREKFGVNPIYPVVMTDDLSRSSETTEFCTHIARLGWEALDAQGYDMRSYTVFVNALWGQEHHKTSGMDRHSHYYNTMLSGFFFIKVPENSSRILFYDPRDVKTFASLPEKNENEATPASNVINYLPYEGELYITPSWLHHSFVKNFNDTPFKFLHFGLSVEYTNKQPIIV